MHTCGPTHCKWQMIFSTTHPSSKLKRCQFKCFQTHQLMMISNTGTTSVAQCMYHTQICNLERQGTSGPTSPEWPSISGDHRHMPEPLHCASPSGSHKNNVSAHSSSMVNSDKCTPVALRIANGKWYFQQHTPHQNSKGANSNVFKLTSWWWSQTLAPLQLPSVCTTLRFAIWKGKGQVGQQVQSGHLSRAITDTCQNHCTVPLPHYGTHIPSIPLQSGLDLSDAAPCLSSPTAPVAVAESVPLPRSNWWRPHNISHPRGSPSKGTYRLGASSRGSLTRGILHLGDLGTSASPRSA